MFLVTTLAQLVPASRLESRPRFSPTGIASLDERLGGFVRGAINEVVAPRGGAEILLYAALASATGRGERAALVDPDDVFDPESARAAGVVPERLLWARPGGARKALQTAEILLQLDGLDTVALFLGGAGNSARLFGAAQWLRLRRAASLGGAVLLVGAGVSLAGHFSAVRLRLHSFRAHWSGRALLDGCMEGLELCLRIERGPPRATPRDFWARMAA